MHFGVRLTASLPPYADGNGFLVREEDVDKYVSLESLKDAIVICQSGSIQESMFNEQVGKDGCKELKLVSSTTDGYLAVKEGKADVCISNISSADLYAEANGGVATTEYRFVIDPNMNGAVIAMPPEGSEALCEVVNEVIAELTAAGKIAEWEEYYEAYAKELGIE